MRTSPDAPWKISEREYPVHGRPEQKLHHVLRYALLAPSRNNDQPWLFEVNGDSVLLRVDRSRALPVVDPEGRESTMSCGAALFNLRVALAHFDLGHGLTLIPDPATPDLLASIRLTGEPCHEDDIAGLFPAIARRHTARGAFKDQPLPHNMIPCLRAGAEAEGAWLRDLSAEGPRRALAELVAEGDRAQGADPAFRRELAAWINPRPSRHADGLPREAFGLGRLGRLVAPLAVRAFDWGARQAARDRELVMGAPGLVALGTDADTRSDWLRAGQAVERVLLTAAGEGVEAGWLGAPVEVASLRERLSVAIGRPGRADAVLRLGYPRKALQPTTRRGLGEVLTPPPA